MLALDAFLETSVSISGTGEKHFLALKIGGDSIYELALVMYCMSMPFPGFFFESVIRILVTYFLRSGSSSTLMARLPRF